MQKYISREVGHSVDIAGRGTDNPEVFIYHVCFVTPTSMDIHENTWNFKEASGTHPLIVEREHVRTPGNENQRITVSQYRF